MDHSAELWRYNQIESAEPQRAESLRAAPPWSDLMAETCRALRSSIMDGTARFGFDESGRDESHLRAVVQFPVGEQIFDWFFNSRTGYRAQFRVGAEHGNEQNSLLIGILRREFHAFESGSISARRLSSSFEDRGPISASIQDVVASLSPLLSKVWFCAKRIRQDSGVEEVTVSTSTPDLIFSSDCAPWRTIYAEDPNAWLDVKGAFVSPTGLYQLKDPMLRAEGLSCRGTA